MNNNYIGVDLSLFRQPEIQKLDISLGKGAVAIYLQICFKLAETDGYFLIQDLPLLEREFFVKKELLENIVNFKDLFVIEGQKFYSKWVLKRIKEIEKKSKLAKKSAEARWSKNPKNKEKASITNGMQTDMRPHSERNAINKRNKINKIKETNNIDTLLDFFEKENLNEIVKQTIIPADNQVWDDQQAKATLDLIKESMINYFENKRKLIKNPKLAFKNWILKHKKTDFYKYANNPTGRALPDPNNQKSSIETFSWSHTGRTFINHFKKIAYIDPVDFDYNTNEITIFGNKYKSLGYEIKT